ncbi:hypothetical protein [Caldifermentibacillus hisashii]|uniref:hypothetical protein n=1 Tax=Caldifermentibacillus hisashii TaxID=996558 RepID=UPI0031016B47
MVTRLRPVPKRMFFALKWISNSTGIVSGVSLDLLIGFYLIPKILLEFTLLPEACNY